MPTGYTAAVQDGTIDDFATFAWKCARGMGALVMMRDEPHDAPIPKRFEPAPYYAEKVADATARIAELEAMTPQQAHDASTASYIQEHSRWIERRKTEVTHRDRYAAMLRKVHAWEPPSDDHAGFKTFMLEQLESSMKFDCGGSEWDKRPSPVSSSEWHATAIAEARKSLAYYEKSLSEELDRCESRNGWLDALRASVGEPAKG